MKINLIRICALVFLLAGFPGIFTACNNQKKNHSTEINTQVSEEVSTMAQSEEKEIPADENERIKACIEEIVDLITVKTVDKEKHINPRDAVLCSGNLTGMFMFLSFNFKYQQLEPGSVLLSEEANELGPKVISRFLYELKQYGIEITKTDNSNIYESSLTYLDMLERTQKDAMDIVKKYGFDYRQAIVICISASAFIVQNVSSNVNEAFGIAAYGIIQGSKTIPYYYE